MKFTISEVDFVIRILDMINVDILTVKQHYNIEALLDFLKSKKNDYLLQEEQNKEELNLEIISDRKELDRLKNLKRCKAYAKANKEKVSKYHKKYYERNKKEINENHRERYLLKKAIKCWKLDK